MKHTFALDLKNDPTLIAEYEAHHQAVWPEILQSIREAGITSLDIYRTGNRLFMTMEVAPHFSFEKKAEADAGSVIVQEWESLMWTFQQALPWAAPGEKWMKMERIFSL